MLLNLTLMHNANAKPNILSKVKMFPMVFVVIDKITIVYVLTCILAVYGINVLVCERLLLRQI